MRINSLLIVCFWLFIACKANKEIYSNDEIICIKFIENYNTFSVPINHRNFWTYPDYHVKYKFMYKNFTNDIDKLEGTNKESIEDYTFAFIVNNGIDTVYSDANLNYFYLPKDDKIKYADDPKINFKKFFYKYSFFNNCW